MICRDFRQVFNFGVIRRSKGSILTRCELDLFLQSATNAAEHCNVKLSFRIDLLCKERKKFFLLNFITTKQGIKGNRFFYSYSDNQIPRIYNFDKITTRKRIDYMSCTCN